MSWQRNTTTNWTGIKAGIFYTLLGIIGIVFHLSVIALTGYIVYLIIIAVIKEVKKPSSSQTKERFLQ